MGCDMLYDRDPEPEDGYGRRVSMSVFDCPHCGAAVADKGLHIKWHGQLRSALSLAMPGELGKYLSV